LFAAAALVPACTPRQAHSPPTTSPGLGSEGSGDPVVVVPDEVAAPVELEIITELANRFIPADTPGEVLARIQIRSLDAADRERPRANIALVVDTSASMEGEAIVEARQAALTLLDDLRDGDVLSVIAFGSSAEVLVPATQLEVDSRKNVRAAIEEMKAWGTTDLTGGLQAGLQQVQSWAQAGEINRIVLVSDGVPNDEVSIVALAQQARAGGIPITTLGLGLDYHETLLGQIAQASGGTFHFVEEPDDVVAVFHNEVLSIDRLAARGLSVTLTPGPGVTILEVPGYGVGHSGRNVVVGLPDLTEGDSQTIIVKLSFGAHREGANVELLDGVINYMDTSATIGLQGRTFVAARATSDAKELEEGIDLDVAVAATRAMTAQATLAVVSMARAGQLKPALALLDRTVTHAKAMSEKMPDAELARLIDNLVELRPTLKALVPPPPPRQPRQARRPSKARAQPPGTPHPGMKTKGGTNLGLGLSDEGARGVRTSHERAYKVLHGG